MIKKILLLLLLTANAQAATYYMSTTGSNSANGSSSTPWLTLQYAMANMSGGDTLIVKDGTYTGTANAISNFQNPPAGSSSQYTIVKAENDGKVVFDGEGVRAMFDIEIPTFHEEYWQFEGIIWGRTTGCNVMLCYTGHVKFLRCGAYDAFGSNSFNFGFGGGDKYILAEDCYAYGAGRYKFEAGDTDYVVFRHCVGRLDWIYSPSEPIGIFTAYSTRHTEFQNCIAIDSDRSQYWWYGEPAGGFTCPSTAKDSCDTSFRKSIILNSHMGGFGTAKNDLFSSIDCTAEDCVQWNLSQDKSTKGTFQIFGDTTTVVRNTLGNIDSWMTFFSYNKTSTNNSILKNSLLYNCTASDYIFSQWENEDYNSFYLTSAATYYLCSAGANTNNGTIDFMWSLGNPTGALKYLPFIEKDSNVSTEGEEGTRQGANADYLIGIPGTLWGETGWDVVTSTPMWPYPNEGTLKEKFGIYVGSVVAAGVYQCDLSGYYGFASSTTKQLDGVSDTTLTSYVLETLGNQMPSDLPAYYASRVSTETIESPELQYVLYNSSVSIRVKWHDLSSNEEGFRVQRSSWNGNYQTIGQTASDIGQYDDVSASPNTTYYYRVAAFNSYGTTSYSNVVDGFSDTDPRSPTFITATSLSSSSIHVEWTDNSDNEEGFHIYHSTWNGGFILDGSVTANTTYYDSTGLDELSRHYFEVKAYKEESESSGNELVNRRFLHDDGYPFAINAYAKVIPPSDLTVVAVSSTSLKLDWKNNSTKYSFVRVYNSVDGVNFYELTSLSAGTTTYTKTGLTATTTYYYKMAAYVVSPQTIYSDYTNIVSTTPGSYSAEETESISAPSNLTAVALSSTSIYVTWEWEDNSKAFEIESSTDGVTYNALDEIMYSHVATPAFYYTTDIELIPSTQYFYRVRTVDYDNELYSEYATISATTNAIPAGITTKCIFKNVTFKGNVTVK